MLQHCEACEASACTDCSWTAKRLCSKCSNRSPERVPTKKKQVRQYLPRARWNVQCSPTGCGIGLVPCITSRAGLLNFGQLTSGWQPIGLVPWLWDTRVGSFALQPDRRLSWQPLLSLLLSSGGLLAQRFGEAFERKPNEIWDAFNLGPPYLETSPYRSVDKQIQKVGNLEERLRAARETNGK